MPFGFDVREGELDFSVDAPGTDKGWVQRVDAVGGHDNFDVPAGIESVELVEEFKHRSLDFALPA